MVDEKETTQDKPEDAVEAEEEGVQSETISELDRAEAANKEKKELLEREEKLQARKEKLHSIQMVGGKAEAGSEPEVKEETPADYAKRIQKNEV